MRRFFVLIAIFSVCLSLVAVVQAQQGGMLEKALKDIRKIFEFFLKIFSNLLRGGFIGQRNISISGSLRGNGSWLLKAPVKSLFLMYKQPAQPIKFNGQALISEKPEVRLNLSSWKGVLNVSLRPFKLNLDGTVKQWELAGVGVEGPSKIKTENLLLEKLRLNQIEIHSLPVEKVRGKLFIGEQQEISFSRERGIAKIRGFKGNISFMEGFLELEGKCNSVLVRSGQLRTEITT